jgi:hypothetical protein
MNEVVVRPLRFTDQVPVMRGFLEALGLRSRIESERGGWVDMIAGRGMFALHDAASSSTGGKHGDTRLAFEADDIDELRERLDAAGYEDATVFDEAFGRVMSVTGPESNQIWIDERSKDLYGYRLHDAHPDARWSVTPVLGVSDQVGWERFLDVLGSDCPELIRFEAGTEFAVRLELTTAEGLGEVADRLTATGYGPSERTSGALTVVDPDGQLVRVRG